MRRCPQCHNEYEAEARFCPVDGTATVSANVGPTEVMDPLIGTTLGGRYRVERKLGQGGMGAVYRGEHVGLGKPVAIKVLLERFAAQKEALARFHKEARAASMIAHENIVDVIDVGEERGHAYIVMELLPGRDLGQVLREGGPLPPARAAHILRQICRALSVAHGKGIIHRDMKPENVFLVEREGRAELVKLMDFGISKVRQAHEESLRLTETGAVMGTPMYMSPEQARGETHIDHRVDVYAVGVMLYEMVVGEPPFRHPTYLGLLSMHLNQKPVPPRKRNPAVPIALERAILRAMEKDPAKRFQSMAEFEAALAELAATPPTVTERPVRAAKKRWPWLAGALGLFAVALGIAIANPFATHRPQPAPIVMPAPPRPAAPLVQTTANVTLLTDPAGATASIDGNPVGKTPISRECAPGEHVFSFQLPGYEPREIRRKLEPGENKDVDVALEKAVVAAPPAVHKAHKKAAPAAKPPPVQPPIVPPPAKKEDSGHKPNPYE